MLRARASSMSFFTLGTMGTQRGRTPQLSFMRSSTRSAVVFGSTVTALSSGFGGSFTLSQSAVMSVAPAGVAAENIVAAINAAQNFDPVASMAFLLVNRALRDLARPQPYSSKLVRRPIALAAARGADA